MHYPHHEYVYVYYQLLTIWVASQVGRGVKGADRALACAGGGCPAALAQSRPTWLLPISASRKTRRQHCCAAAYLVVRDFYDFYRWCVLSSNKSLIFWNHGDLARDVLRCQKMLRGAQQTLLHQRATVGRSPLLGSVSGQRLSQLRRDRGRLLSREQNHEFSELCFLRGIEIPDGRVIRIVDGLCIIRQRDRLSLSVPLSAAGGATGSAELQSRWRYVEIPVVRQAGYSKRRTAEYQRTVLESAGN